MRYLSLTLRILALTLLNLAVPGLRECHACCSPGIQWSASGSITYRFGTGDSPFVQVQRDEFNRGAQEWTGAFAAAGSSVQVVESASGEWNVVWSFQLGNNWGQIDPGQHVIYLNYNLVNDYGFMQHVFRHEISHILGFGHGDCSATSSVMGIGSPGGPYQTSVGGCEHQVVNTYYYNPCANGGCTSSFTRDTSVCNPNVTDQCGCCFNETPIVIDLAGDGVRFSNAESGAVFQINDIPGHRFRLGWPEGPDDAWLVRDVNRNGSIDNGAELFGNATRLPTGGVARDGYAALRAFDQTADNLIDARDRIFIDLLVWADRNRNGRSESDELQTLGEVGIAALSLEVHEDRRRDRWGNVFRYRSDVIGADGARKRRFAYDVFPVAEPIAGGAITGGQCGGVQ